VPAAHHQVSKQGALDGLVIEVKGLRVELASERLDLRLVNRVRFTGKPLPDVDIVEIESIVSIVSVNK
jgi:hypothetical protein